MNANNPFRWLQRMCWPIVDLKKIPRGVFGYGWFIADALKFRSMGGRFSVWDMIPRMDEKVASEAYDRHYLLQDYWAFSEIAKLPHKTHTDISSSLATMAFLSNLKKVVYVEYRPPDMPSRPPNLELAQGDILALPFKDNSIGSLSCLHVPEHVGLGRYGDPVDPQGTEKACKELARVLAPGGHLFFSLPVGRPKVCFNSHRIHHPDQILGYFGGLKLASYHLIDDDGALKTPNPPGSIVPEYGCGLYHFVKHD